MAGVLADLGKGLRAGASVLNPRIQQQQAQASENQVAREFAANEARDNFTRQQGNMRIKLQLQSNLATKKQLSDVAQSLDQSAPDFNQKFSQLQSRADQIDQQNQQIMNSLATDTNVGTPQGMPSTPLPGPEPAGASFGKGLIGRSQDNLLNFFKQEDAGKPLSSLQNMQKAFAIKNLTQERTQVRTDPNTGEQFSVTIKPQLPESISSRIAQDSSGGVTVDPINVGGGPSRKTRQEAETTLRDLGNARVKAIELAKIVTETPSVTGLTGSASRVISGIGGQIPGVDVDTDAATFKRKLELLRSDMRVLIDKGRFSDEDRKRLNALVAGTGVLDDPKSTAEGFVQLVDEMDRQIATARDTLDQGGVQSVSPEIQSQADEQAGLNGWNEEEKQRFIQLLQGNQ